MTRTDTHDFKGLQVIANANGRLSIMTPYRTERGEKKHRAEGDFADRKELAAFCHGKLIGWMNV